MSIHGDSAATSSQRSPLADELATSGARSPWYRRDWITVLGGLAAITAVNFTSFEVALHALGVHPTNPGTHMLYEARLVTGIFTTALWVGWRAHTNERKLTSAIERASADEAELARQRWRVEQAEGLAAFSRVLAHELRNPLHALVLHGTVVRRAAAQLQGAGADAVRKAADVLAAETQRMGALLDDYLAYGGGRELTLEQEELELDALAAEAIAARRAVFEQRGVTASLRAEGPLPLVRGDRARLVQAIHHVVQHAVDALPRGGHVDVALEADGGQVVLRVTDDGPGFADPKAVFRPFFTSHARGAGFGFALVRDIVRAHRGEVAARNVGKRGGCVEIRLPVGDRR